MRATEATPDEGVEVYDVDSGMGGYFTVSIVQEMDDGIVLVRVWQGEFIDTLWKSYGLFDGKAFTTYRSRLVNQRKIC
ncbi:hypothetical protein [Neorhizobium galegae]|uniref:hypothetical protein n=1 Tax=Neorhizobium galegae TaxID=399 RepID=UPI0006221B8C|nr:hypothetical protein [Neorhizobium galegae]CDZ30153.1 Hypothetical protein NGAL_HAMBI490_50210 [Neorhizobium galegae bv. officinalis]KAA9384034.1 hypothetical protein F4V88_27705 [Neorhizobium galegae]KAB1110157.1 hypothetical protein F4V89_25310 [Neorhizobium galegae]MCM2498676.1 hypothetical protein [Neorhizobium galegae]MCQ1774467.1 hypothetical protein [Neorhizobium galegae]